MVCVQGKKRNYFYCVIEMNELYFERLWVIIIEINENTRFDSYMFCKYIRNQQNYSPA